MATDLLDTSPGDSLPTQLLTETRAGDAAVRRATPSHRAALYRFLTSLSPRSTIQRFHGPGFRATEDMLDRLLRSDGSGMAVVALDDGAVVVGHAMWAPVPAAPAHAEVAVVVAETHRGQGLGTRLVQAVLGDARRRGVDALEASVLADNEETHRLVRRFSPQPFPTLDHGVVDYRFALGARLRRPEIIEANPALHRDE